MAGEKIVKIMQQMGDPKGRSDTTELMFGVVTKTSPLTIKVDNRFEISGDTIILTKAVKDFTVNMTVNHTTENHSHTHTISDTYTGGGSASTETHRHEYKGKKAFTVHLGLDVGEAVILLRVYEGQKFIVIDRV